MAEDRDLLRGNIPTLILAVVSEAPVHGLAIAREINQRSNNALQLKQGTLYPALGRWLTWLLLWWAAWPGQCSPHGPNARCETQCHSWLCRPLPPGGSCSLGAKASPLRGGSNSSGCPQAG